MKSHRLAPLFVLLAACTGGSEQARIPGYLTSDACNDNADETSCLAAGCAWAGLESCPDDTQCPEGVCYAPDPCSGHGDEAACTADTANNCQWAAAELCPPDVEDCGNGGFCYSGGTTDECVCVCPLYCPEGEECPPCDCSCPPPDGGGGGGTCTCVCPDCPEGETCPPCDCTCDEGSGGGGTDTCTCPDCPPDQTCPPCECQTDPSSPLPPEQTDPCLAYTDELTCAADTANQCQWINLGIPCQEGVECISGVCQGPFSGGDCTCVCPECDAEPCPLDPCTCDCGGGTGCIEPQPAG